MKYKSDMFFWEYTNDFNMVGWKINREIASGSTEYQTYSIWESPMGLGVVIDGDLQSIESDRSTYHEALVHPAMLLHGSPRHVMVCGGGEGATIREVLRYDSVEKVTMVDIDREFVEVCKAYIPEWSAGAFTDPRTNLIHQDIFEFVEKTDERYDVIIGDLTDLVEEVYPGKSFHGQGFYQQLKNLLRDDGILCTQASALTLFEYAKHLAILKNIREVFTSVQSYRCETDSFFTPWGFVMAGKKELPGTEAIREIFKKGFETHHLDLDNYEPESLAACFALNKRIKRLVNQE